MLRRLFPKLRALADNREGVSGLEVVAGFIACLLFAAAFLHNTLPELLIIAGAMACPIALWYLTRYLRKL